MGWIIAVIIFIGLICFMMSGGKPVESNLKSKYGDDCLKEEICNYYGGFRTITNSKTCNIIKFKEKFIFDFYKK